MSRSRFLACCLLAFTAAGCKAQSSPDNPQINRRIEILVRSQLQVPADYKLTLGTRTKSSFPGYDTLPITFSVPSKPNAKPVTVEYLLSDDGNTLIRMQKFDLTKDPAAQIPTADRPVRGDAQAKVTIVNFDDLECPYCARMHAELFPQTLDRYKGLVKFIYKDDPLIELHPWAMHAAVDANCLAAESPAAYWSYVDYVHSHGDEISGPDRDPAKAALTLDRLAREQGFREKVDQSRLNACLQKQDESVVRASMKEADNLNVDGTPTLFVNGERISGWTPPDQLYLVIDRALMAAGEKPPATEAPKQDTPAAAANEKAPAGN